MPQRFWAHPALPFLHLRATDDGRTLCYGLHSHAEFSVGLIEAGYSLFRHGRVEEPVGPGDLVLMNPGLLHACRARDEARPWAYTMLYVEPDWLAALQQPGLNAIERRFQPLGAAVLRQPALSQGFRDLVQALASPTPEAAPCAAFFRALCAAAGRAACSPQDPRLQAAIALMQARHDEALSLADFAAAAGLSVNHLTRLFRAHTGLTPHAYLNDVRVRASRALLRQGELPLAEVAAATGFADQAHWQRHYRRQHASTPGAYRRGLFSAKARAR